MTIRERKISKSFWALTLVLVMFLTNILGAGEVSAESIPAPTIDKVFYDATSISGGNLYRKKVGRNTERATVYVTLKYKNGNVKDNVSVTPTKGNTWTVNLSAGKKVEEGDTVTVYQQLGEDKSPEQTINAQPAKADLNKDKLKMPTGEIWIEQTSSNHVNEDEQAEAVKMFNNVNTAIAGDIKSVKFSIDGTDHAYYEVTYTDDSTSGKVEAPKLKINTVTETSAAPTIQKVQVTDGQIVVTFDKDVDANTKFYFIKNFTDGEEKNFCEGGNCKVDKSTKQDMSQEVSVDGKKVTFPIKDKVNDLKLGTEFGIVVKEPHKFRSCAKSEPVVTTPDKVEVRDPRKLTDEEKKAIDGAIRAANTVNGVSKLPNGTGFISDPAFIEFDKNGNVKIISPNDVEVTWDSDGNPIYEKNPDGTYKLQTGKENNAYEIPAKDLVLNKAPDAPDVNLSKDKKNITITPKKLDTDAKKVSVTYKGKDGSTKTITAEKGDSGWSITKGEGATVDQNGVITLPTKNVKAGEDVTATVKDAGGIADDDKKELTSDPGTLTIKTKAKQVTELGGLDPVDIKKWVGDEIKEGFWKDGVKAKDDTKKEDVDKLLVGATFTDETETKRSTEKSGEFVGKIKVTFDDGSEIVVENQKLMVCDHVTSTTDPKLPKDAIEVKLKLGEGVKVEDIDPNTKEVLNTHKGNKDNPVLYKTYMAKPGTNLNDYKNPILGDTIFNLVNEKADTGYVDSVWKDSKGEYNFVVAKDNNEFTATATKIEKYEVTFDPNGGSGSMEKVLVKKGENYKLPQNTFTPPNEDQEFAGWLVDGSTKITAPDTEITINKDTVIKASWKPIEYKVVFDGNGGTGTMDSEIHTKGSEYVLPEPAFKAPENKEFDGWKVNGESKKVGDRIIVTGTMNVVAQWKNKDGVEDPINPNEKPEEGGRVQPWPGYWWYFGNNTDPIQATEVKTQEEKVEMEKGIHHRYMYGYPDGTVRPEGTMTRAEAAALIARLAELDMSNKSKPNFKDTEEAAWYNSAINAMVSKDLMFADKDGNFRPNEAITRAEFARALYGVDKKNDKVAPFADVKGHEFEAAINQAYGNGRINGYPDGTFRPDAYIQRAEAAKILNQYAGRGVDMEGINPVRKDLIHFTDINESHWAYYEIMEAANTHEYQRARGSLIETWLQILDK